MPRRLCVRRCLQTSKIFARFKFDTVLRPPLAWRKAAIVSCPVHAARNSRVDNGGICVSRMCERYTHPSAEAWGDARACAVVTAALSVELAQEPTFGLFSVAILPSGMRSQARAEGSVGKRQMLLQAAAARAHSDVFRRPHWHVLHVSRIDELASCSGSALAIGEAHCEISR